ncbi:hypothetical protein AG1IA_05118 [Rhizoctonia solani AG-1 IA]|uniref:Uncharacterized protein n=1 Tax=Thanatephorus cucumeris (strain AG1-IA) TaxID=983506 RepID=L8WVR5_THACA|nr:hypothetical protein AG1IA_05118 [Rhizoctonia solani AG-1 IA]
MSLASSGIPKTCNEELYGATIDNSYLSPGWVSVFVYELLRCACMHLYTLAHTPLFPIPVAPQA